MKLYKCLLTENRCYKAGRKIKPKGVMVHSTGANNPSLGRYVQTLDHDVPGAYSPDRQSVQALLDANKYGNDWNRPDGSACVHAFIGRLKDGTVACIQTLPWDHRGWHAASGIKGTANDTHISFEICEDSLISEDYFKQTYQTAVELVAMLCTEYNLDPAADGVIICHQDGYRRGIASNHGDIYNWWPKFGYSMDEFRRDVLLEMYKGDEDEMVKYRKLEDVPEYYRPTVDKCIKAGGIRGTGKGDLNLSEDLCRTLTILDRMGKLD